MFDNEWTCGFLGRDDSIANIKNPMAGDSVVKFWQNTAEASCVLDVCAVRICRDQVVQVSTEPIRIQLSSWMCVSKCHMVVIDSMKAATPFELTMPVTAQYPHSSRRKPHFYLCHFQTQIPNQRECSFFYSRLSRNGVMCRRDANMCISLQFHRAFQ